MIIDNASLRQNMCARALNFLEVFAIDRHDLDEVAQLFPEVARGIRRVAIRLAARRAFIRHAKSVLNLRAGRKRSMVDAAFSIEASNAAFVSAAPVGAPAAIGVAAAASGASLPADREVRRELSRQAAKQDELASAVALLTQAVEGLRRDLQVPAANAPEAPSPNS